MSPEKIGEQICHIRLRGDFGAQILLAENFVPKFYHMFGDSVHAYNGLLPHDVTCAYHISFLPSFFGAVMGVVIANLPEN